MATYFLSTSPTVPNFSIDPGSLDFFVIDTTSASRLSVAQVGGNVVISDGVLGHTATLQNFSITQIAPNQFTANDGSLLLVGDLNNNAIFPSQDQNANVINGSANNDQLIGLGGTDTLDGLGGNDLIYGNQAADTVNGTGAAGNDTVFGGQGNDTVNYGPITSGNALVYGNLGDDTLTGGLGNDSLFGGQGNDSIVGNAGNDLVFGGIGLDTIEGGAGNDLIYGNQGEDNILGNTGNDTIFGGQDQDVINGGADNDLIYGNLGADSLQGGAGNDTIFGGQGNDTIAGGVGAGADVLSGGLGNDRFNEDFSPPSDSGVTTATADTITDFVTGQDFISSTPNGPGTPANYREFALGTVTSVENAVTAYQAATNPISTYTFIAGGTNGYLVVDIDGNHTADGVVVLTGLNTLAGFDSTDIR